MRTHYAAGLAIALVLFAGKELNAQAKPTAYAVIEIEVTNLEGYTKEFAALPKAIVAGGGKFLARGGKTVAILGAPPQPRSLIVAFDSLEKAQAAFESDAYRNARKAVENYAKFRIFAIEGVAQPSP